MHGTTTIDHSDGSEGEPSRIRVYQGAELRTGSAVVAEKGRLELFGGYVAAHDQVTVAPGDALSGQGTFMTRGQMTNDGLIEAKGDTLRLTTLSSDSVWDLDDASGQGSVAVVGVPEPTPLAFLGAGLALFSPRHRVTA